MWKCGSQSARYGNFNETLRKTINYRLIGGVQGARHGRKTRRTWMNNTAHDNIQIRVQCVNKLTHSLNKVLPIVDSYTFS